MKYLNNILLFIFGLVIVGFESYKIVLTFTPPFSISTITPISTTLRAGEDLVLDHSFVRNRICRSTLDRFIVSVSEDSVIWRSSVPGGASKLGPGKVRNIVPLPKDLPPGNYKYLSTVFGDCFEGMHANAWPEVVFTVLP